MLTKLLLLSYRDGTAHKALIPYSWSTPHMIPFVTVECLFQINKMHVDWFGKLPCILKDPVEGTELVHCSTAITKTKLFLLNPGLNYWPNSPIQYPGVDLIRKV